MPLKAAKQPSPVLPPTSNSIQISGARPCPRSSEVLGLRRAFCSMISWLLLSLFCTSQLQTYATEVGRRKILRQSAHLLLLRIRQTRFPSSGHPLIEAVLLSVSFDFRNVSIHTSSRCTKTMKLKQLQDG